MLVTVNCIGSGQVSNVAILILTLLLFSFDIPAVKS